MKTGGSRARGPASLVKWMSSGVARSPTSDKKVEGLRKTPASDLWPPLPSRISAHRHVHTCMCDVCAEHV